jgi:flagellar motor switch protein FliM
MQSAISKKKKNTREKARTVPGANFFKDWPMSLHKIMRLKFGGMIEVIKRERELLYVHVIHRAMKTCTLGRVYCILSWEAMLRRSLY